MSFYINPCSSKTSMRLWPYLAERAFFLSTSRSGAGETIFYYDSPPCIGVSHGETSAPVFVLIHGLGDEADSWRHLIPFLNARGFRVLAVDLPGFGRSVTKKRINIKNHVSAVLKLIEAAVSGARVFLAGNSMGAMVAESAAFQRPDLVKGLVLIDGNIPGGPSNPGLLALAKLLLRRKWYRSYQGNPEGAWASLYPYYADLDSMPPGDKEFLKQRVMDRVESSTQEKAFFATQRSLVWTYLSRSSAFAQKVKDYKGKILLLWGEMDRLIPLSSAEVFKALRDDIRLELIPGAGHLPQQEKPEETARRMADFADGAIG